MRFAVNQWHLTPHTPSHPLMRFAVKRVRRQRPRGGAVLGWSGRDAEDLTRGRAGLRRGPHEAAAAQVPPAAHSRT